MADPIITELWDIKDSIAREHGNDIESLVSSLRNQKRPEGQVMMNLESEASEEQRPT
jgi:hypothetical protein